jgi:hypothetical protein
MAKHQLIVAVGPIVAALILGGLLYVFYPNTFAPYSSTSGATGSTFTASSGDQQYIGMEQTGPSEQSNIAANQNATATTQGNMSTATPSTEPSLPSDNSGY